MQTVIGVRFRGSSKIYYFDPKDYNIPKDSFVVVETARGLEYLQVELATTQIDETKLQDPIKPILRPATENDTQKHSINKQKAAGIFETVLGIIERSGLDMRLNHIEYTLDRSKLLIYFGADGRVDFRELVKELASRFGVRIELRQINERDEYKVLGTLGSCGQECCCARGLAIPKTSMKMAKTQGLPMNIAKLSGVCGKIRCCMAYENEYYDTINKKCPKVGSSCCTSGGGCCKVMQINHLQETVQLKVEEGDKVEFVSVQVDELDTKLKSTTNDKNETVLIYETTKAGSNDHSSTSPSHYSNQPIIHTSKNNADKNVNTPNHIDNSIDTPTNQPSPQTIELTTSPNALDTQNTNTPPSKLLTYYEQVQRGQPIICCGRGCVGCPSDKNPLNQKNKTQTAPSNQATPHQRPNPKPPHNHSNPRSHQDKKPNNPSNHHPNANSSQKANTHSNNHRPNNPNNPNKSNFPNNKPNTPNTKTNAKPYNSSKPNHHAKSNPNHKPTSNQQPNNPTNEIKQSIHNKNPQQTKP